MFTSAPGPHASHAACRLTGALRDDGALQACGPVLGHLHVWPAFSCCKATLGQDGHGPGCMHCISVQHLPVPPPERQCFGMPSG